jgi:hypothetical protein
LTLDEYKKLAETAFAEINTDKHEYELVIMNLKTHEIEQKLVNPN